MTVDMKALLAKQAAWQRARAARPWGDKLRESVAVRASVRALRKEQPTVGGRSAASASPMSRRDP